MAKKEDKGKIRVFLFELEGTNETLLESVRSITGALNRTFNGNPRVTRLISATDDVSNPIEEYVDDDFEQDDYAEPDESEGRGSSTKPKRPRRITTPNILNELDLNRAPVPLKTFVDEKKPNDNTKKYLVIATWLKNYHEIDEISSDHIYTCYRFLRWNTPKDVGSILRSGKKEGYYVSGGSRGSYRITHVGENRVQDMA